MLLQLEDTQHENVNKLLAFAKANHIKLSLVDEVENNYTLPGRPLTSEQITSLIENGRKSGIISMKKAHEIISNGYKAD